MTRAIVVGGGVFGLTAALELRARGLDVVLVDPGPLPHPLAESTDISKVVRLDYGADAEYTALGEQALDGWRAWNAAWPRALFHETGVTFLSRSPMQPGGFEHDSYHLLVGRGHPLVRLDAAAITARFPAYAPGVHVDGYYNPLGGWAEATEVVRQLGVLAHHAGVDLRPAHAVLRIVDDGVLTAHGHLAGDLVVVCAGAWVPRLIPELATAVRAIGQPVFHLRPHDPSRFEAARFPVFGADISGTGYYGFPVNRDGLVKIANHGTGVRIDDDAQRVVHPGQEAALRMFLREAFPALVDAPIVHRRLCVYGDTADEHFWIARHPERGHLVVATGGSGHAFKFAPVLGPLIADVALGVAHPLAHKFRWRPGLATHTAGDAARHR